MPTVDTDSIESYFSVGALVVVEYSLPLMRRQYARCILRGWQNNAYILLDPCEPEQIRPLHRKDPCAIRFIESGSVCGFTTTILDPSDALDREFKVAWPKQFQVKRLRMYERVKASIPCSVRVAGEAFEGCTIHDISVGGCGVTLPRKLELGAEAQIEFDLMNWMPLCLKASARKATPAGGAFDTGFAFLDADVSAQEAIRFFVCTRLEHARTTDDHSLRVVVYETDPGNSRRILEHLAENGIEVAAAACLVDAFHLLRLTPPHAFVIGNVAPGLAAEDVARIVLATHGCESMLIFIVGEQPASSDGSPEIKTISKIELIQLTNDIKMALAQGT